MTMGLPHKLLVMSAAALLLAACAPRPAPTPVAPAATATAEATVAPAETPAPLPTPDADDLARIKSTGDRISGFGHRIHTKDPRTARMFELASSAGLNGNPGTHIGAAHAVERAFAAIGKPLPINVDGAIGAILVGWVLATQVFDFAYRPGWWLLPVGTLAGGAFSAAAGWWSLRSVVRTPPMASLRGA